MITCERVKPAIGAWLDGELPASEAEATRLHVETCPVCGEEQRQLEHLHASLHAALTAGSAKPVFEPFWQEVQQRITRKTTWRESFTGWIHGTLTPPRLAWAVPALIIVVLAGLSVDFWLPGLKGGAPRDNFVAVESIDTYGRNVALLREDETKTMVIWLYQESENESSTEPAEIKPAF
jgi:hypothetical protein